MRDIDRTLTFCHQRAAKQLSDAGDSILTLEGKNRTIGFCSSYNFGKEPDADQRAAFFAITSAMTNMAPCIISGHPDTPCGARGSFRKSSGEFLSCCDMILILSASPTSNDIIQICSPVLPRHGKLYGCMTGVVRHELEANLTGRVTLNRYYGMQNPLSLARYYTHVLNAPALELKINAECLKSEGFWVSLSHALCCVQDGIEILFTKTCLAA